MMCATPLMTRRQSPKQHQAAAPGSARCVENQKSNKAVTAEQNRINTVTMEVSRSGSPKKDGSASPQSKEKSSSWKAQAAACATQDAALRRIWIEPDHANIKLRGKTYLEDNVKVTADPPLFELVWFDLFHGKHEDLFHISQSKHSFVQKATAKYGNDMPQILTITILIPGTPEVACVQYFALKHQQCETARATEEGLTLWKRFCDGDDAFRRTRLKLIPGIAEGPWVVKKSVGAKPFIISNVLEVSYFQGPNYLEAVVDVSSDRIAKHVTSLCRSHASSLTVDMGFVIEGKDEAELPESLLCCVRSARQIKRMNKLAAASAVPDDVDEEEEEEELEDKRPAPAGFLFLVDSDSDSDEEDDDDDDDDDGDEDEEEGSDEEASDSVPAPAPVAVVEPKKIFAKKKQSKKHEESEEDVDKLLDEMVAQAGEMTVEVATSLRNQAENTLLSVHLHSVNADKEMMRIFGVKEVREASGGRQRMDPRALGRKTTKKVFMVTPHDEWPRPPTFVSGGIRWTRSNKPKGPCWSGACQYYEISWSAAYKKAQAEFELVQQTHDPNVVGLFLRRYPFHIDALLQMSEVFQHHGQMDHASDCIKRCVYVLELAWADQFDVTKGNCRMDFHTEHNDAFYRALFLLMKQVGRRGCVRSAFEVAKMVLSLDPHGDPMNVLLAIDYYALAARQCQFLIDLAAAKFSAVDRMNAAAADKPKRPKQVTDEAECINALPNLQFSLALAHYFNENKDTARELLAKALLQFPSVLPALLEKCSVSTTSGEWATVLGSRVFANASHVADGSVLQHLLDIYVTRNFSLWKVNEVQRFLLEGAKHAVDFPSLSQSTPQVMEVPEALLKYRRAVTADYSDEITTLPADHPMMQQLQIPNLEDLDEGQLEALARAQEQMAAGNLPADANPLLLFLQTLLPWNHVQGARPPAGGGNPPQ
ncbi:TPA: hypothetical protein N0F65_008569 [Lagenidium giganteum]|uniref:Protein ENHANCED DISEASE RESISTANCE 2 C-terminal domain-containing protein n=1 Tax=Lagenidium giganteum TaxID=4803 RepID=A0AAV2YIE7_9STRA|nr:TPA: hypothetical protein N0F65_008569 [Lagenidium giganteum]